MKQKVAEFFDLVFGFRKFIAWLALFLIGIIFRMKGFIDGGEFVDLIKSTFMGFVAANGVEHVVTCVKEYNAGNLAKALGNQDDNIVPNSEIEDAKQGAT